MDLDNLNGRNGFRMEGFGAGAFFGVSVSSAGDVNGDGIPDLIVGSNRTGSFPWRGASFVLFGREGGYPAMLDMTALDGSDGFRIEGASAGDLSGVSVSAADLNGDGIDDLIIAPGEVFGLYINGAPRPIHVVYGTRAGFPAVLSLADIDGSNGFRILGEVNVGGSNPSWNLRASRAGDINGDGLDDLVIGEPIRFNGAGVPANVGRVYVVYGRSAGFPSTLLLADLDGSNGFSLVRGSAEGDLFGISVGAAGDINGDGVDDLIVGASGVAGGGRAFVLFGDAGGFPANVRMDDLDGSQGLKLFGAGGSGATQMGWSVNGAGDINGDGLDDIIMGNPGGDGLYTGGGNSYVLFGTDQSFATDASGNLNVDIAALLSRGIKIVNGASGEEHGQSVSGIGDVNGDGLDDLAVGAHLLYHGVGRYGSLHVLFGTTEEILWDIVASPTHVQGLDGSNGFSVIAGSGDIYVGTSVSRLGDINGDGVDDMIIGARSGNTDTSVPGRAIVVFGGLTGPGEVPVAGLSQTALDFGDVLLGQTSPVQTVTLQNIGYVHALVLGPLALSGADAGDFSLSNDSCSNQSLAQDATCSFDIALSPGAAGARSASVDIPSNAPSGPDVVALDGVGAVLPDALFSDGFEGG